MVWSVGEQSIPTAAFMGDQHPHISSINLRMDPSHAHIMIMELHTEPDGSGLEGYLLLFNTGGSFISAQSVVPPPPPSGEKAAAPAAAAHPTGRHR